MEDVALCGISVRIYSARFIGFEKLGIGEIVFEELVKLRLGF